MPIPAHVTNPPPPDRRYIQTLAAYIRDLSADKGCQLELPDCEYIAERAMSWGSEVVEGTAPVRDPRNPGLLAQANAHANTALHINAARRSIGLNVRPQHTVRQLPNGTYVAVARSCGVPLALPNAGQLAEMGKPVPA